jgi:2-hydroxy-3-keto-5-methylthiopentenyl-1-phosphate phosphatase
MDASTFRRVFVTDFDGTLTRQDFYNLFLEQLYPVDGPNHWAAFCDGTITHFECLRNIYSAVPVGEARLRELLKQIELPPELPKLVTKLRTAGWDLVVASAGSRWYIEQLLAREGVSLTVHTNGGTIVEDRLVMELPTESPFYHPHAGIDKAAVVKWYLDRGCEVAFAGDGITDIPPALCVPPSRRFARGYLAGELSAKREGFQYFDEWAEIVERLTDR